MDPALYKYRNKRARLFLRQSLALAAAWIVFVASSRAAIRVEAYRGEPFGIGKITIDLLSEPDPEPVQEMIPENPLDLGVDFRAPQLGLGD